MTHTICPIPVQSVQSSDFLPPISRWTSLGGMILVGALGVAICLAAVVKYNVVTKADATIRPDGELRVVQADREGSIKHIAVRDYQAVKRGEAIAYLDDTKLQIQQSQLIGSIRQSQTQLDQVSAQIRFLEAQILAESDAANRSVAAAEAETDRNQSDHTERLRTAQADVAEAQVLLEQAQDEWNRYRQLAAAGAVSELQLKEKESAVRTAAVKVERTEALLNPTIASVTIAREGIAQQQARGEATVASLQKERESLVQRQSEIRVQIIRDQKELEQVERDLEQSVIRSAIDGTVFQLNVLNPSQIVRPGESIAQIVPAHTPLVVKANVANQDIEQVKVGQSVQMRVEACPYTDYGTLKGVVKTIAPDVSAQNSTSQGDRTFAVTVEIEEHPLSNGQRQCSLQAGMQASASIISKEETFLRFVLREARIWTDL